MEYIDLKLKKKKTSDEPKEVISENGDKYPYGLQLRFDTEQIEKIDTLKNLDIGEIVKIFGIAKVTELSSREQAGKEESRKDAALQIQQIAVVSSKEEKAMGVKEAMEKIANTRVMD